MTRNRIPELEQILQFKAGCSHFGKYQVEVYHLVETKIVLIMGLFEVLIANMILICGTNMQSKVEHEFWSYLRFSHLHTINI